MLVQAIFTWVQHDPVKSHDIAQWAFGSSVVTTALAISQAVEVGEHSVRHNDPAFILRIANIAVSAILVVACLRLQRRPDVYFRDHKVDAHHTVSAWSRGTWSWARPLLDLATKQGDLDIEDLPQPEHSNRAAWLVESWHDFGFQGKLLHSLIWAYKWHIAFQWVAVLFKAVVGLGPFWAILRLITIMENRSPDEDTADPDLWLLIIYLALFTLAEQVGSLHGAKGRH